LHQILALREPHYRGKGRANICYSRSIWVSNNSCFRRNRI